MGQFRTINGEPKEHLKARLRASGLYDQFILARERFKAQGMTPVDAWDEAAKLFPKPDATDEQRELPSGVLAAVSPEMTQAEDAALAKGARAEAEKLLEEREAFEGVVDDAMWGRMAEAVAGRKASELESIRWVAENIQTKMGTLDVDEIPSAMALNWLRWVRQSPANEAEFWKSSMVKLLPDKKSLEQDAGMKDDGREVLAAIERVRKARMKSETKG